MQKAVGEPGVTGFAVEARAPSRDGEKVLKLGSACRACIFRWVYERSAPLTSGDARTGLAERVSRAIESDTSETANAALLCNRAVFSAREIESKSSLYYEGFKKKSNEQAGELLGRARAYVDAGQTAKERLERAFSLAAAGNVAPLSAPSEVFSFPDVTGIMDGTVTPCLTGDLYGAVLNARRALYFTDNSGEVGFDSLALRAMREMGVHLTLVVKEDTFYEDVTMSDALTFGLEKEVDEIVASPGFFVRGENGPVLNSVYARSDLIISKGTGSFEALKGETPGKKAVFMLKVKCEPVSLATGVEQGRLLVKVDG
jgi:damage-control phosphatase, subfamily I